MGQTIKFPQINLNNVKGVLIDLDNTLYTYDSCHLKAIEKCYGQYRDNLDSNMSFQTFNSFYRSKRDEVTKRLTPQGACRSRLFAFQKMFEDWNAKDSWVLSAEFDKTYWNNFIKHMKIEADALTFLKQCKSMNIPTCVVSDMLANIQIEKLKQLAIVDYIKYLVTSEEVGAEKPNSLMFQTALQKLNLSAQDVIMIGDDYIKDIEGAQILGIKSYKVIIN